MSRIQYTTKRLPRRDLGFMPSLPDAIVLCGGAGLRLRDITGNGPKAMARIAGRPFLELLLQQLRRNGFQRAILAVGYQQEVIRSYFAERTFGLQLAYSAESSPLGTGGALRNAVELLASNSALILNGDSYTNVDLAAFVAHHHESEADASLVVVPADGRGDGGTVLVDENGTVSRFKEKQGALGAQHLNAGIYMVSPSLLYGIPAGVQVSLEGELFPQWLAEGRRIKAYVYLGTCFDIGTPERYRNAQEILANVEVESVPPR